MLSVIRTDVTSVKFFGNYILAGIGSWLHVFSDNSNVLKDKVQVLTGQKIYGIVPLDSLGKILVFGGKQLELVVYDSLKDVFTCSCNPIVTDDWIHSVIWISNIEVAVLTAHNVVEEWSLETRLLQKRKLCKGNSILYSGLLVPLQDGLLVFSGTVFSDILISCAEEEPLYHLKGHKGVIFSISCQLKSSTIVSTSDDRSVRIWGVQSTSTGTYITTDFWRNLKNINCLHELYGHGARVMRNCIINDYIISVGEDSGICYWDRHGNLLRKVKSHTNACIWSVDASDNYIVTGGGDGAVILHPLSILNECNKAPSTYNFGVKLPKKIVFTAKQNIVVMTEMGEIIYYDVSSNTKSEFKLHHETKYKLLSLSACKQLIAVVDMCGKFDIFFEDCKESYLGNIVDTQLHICKVMSMHWTGNRHIVLCTDMGEITVLTAGCMEVHIFAKFSLPYCKERWLTAVAINGDKIIAGDRCGNLHVFVRGQSQPIKTFKNIHGRYGPTSIYFKNKNSIITTDRRGTLKYFSLYEHQSSRDLDFQWIEKFVDKNYNYVCGFQERIFVVFDIVNNRRILEVQCGGGHRSWDVVHFIQKRGDHFNECITFMYIKEGNIYSQTYQLNKIAPKIIINGTHSKEVNCLKSYKCSLATSLTYFISGGEDTTLRITSLNPQNTLKDELVFRHLSSVRTLKFVELNDHSLLLVSAGGRAQICIKKITFQKCDDVMDIFAQELLNYMIKGTDRDRIESKRKGLLNDFDPETRVMDLEISSLDNEEFFIYAGCSDGKLRVYKYKLSGNILDFVEYDQVGFCILRTKMLDMATEKLLINCTTNNLKIANISNKGYVNLNCHKSGINSLAIKVISDSTFLMATGGDDNAVSLRKVSFGHSQEDESWISNASHCSQVTGVILIDNLLVSASIDQRVTVFEWTLDGGLQCEFKLQVFTDIADVQGIELLSSHKNSLTVCVFGKGMEVMSIPRPSLK
ncbi:unnamed protein product [Leptosia nina]|uniref:tRNA (34-2'-O)-methyltransferase regulator WDR6 n=1 Tax=Leptosia nina TaxID=320188 RepID=A0AAV1J141_9NEOP